MCVCLCRRGGLGVEGGKCYSSFPCVFFWFYAAAFLGASCGGGGGDGGVVVMFLEFSFGETLPLYRWVKKTAAAKYRTYYCCNMFNVAACLAETYLISGGVK